MLSRVLFSASVLLYSHCLQSWCLSNWPNLHYFTTLVGHHCYTAHIDNSNRKKVFTEWSQVYVDNDQFLLKWRQRLRFWWLKIALTCNIPGHYSNCPEMFSRLETDGRSQRWCRLFHRCQNSSCLSVFFKKATRSRACCCSLTNCIKFLHY